MKNYLLILFAFLLLAGCKEVKKNDVSPPDHLKDTEIYLTVIGDCNPITSDCIQFSDNRHDSVSIKGMPEKFLSKVNPGKKVIWKGKSSGNHTIELLEVIAESNPHTEELLEEKNIKVKNDGTIVGKIKTKKRNLSFQFYSIIFKVDSDTITIDPVIQLHNY